MKKFISDLKVLNTFFPLHRFGKKRSQILQLAILISVLLIPGHKFPIHLGWNYEISMFYQASNQETLYGTSGQISDVALDQFDNIHTTARRPGIITLFMWETLWELCLEIMECVRRLLDKVLFYQNNDFQPYIQVLGRNRLYFTIVK